MPVTKLVYPVEGPKHHLAHSMTVKTALDDEDSRWGFLLKNYLIRHFYFARLKHLSEKQTMAVLQSLPE